VIFDTHTHLNVDNFAGREAEEIEKAREFGVTKLNIVGFDTQTIAQSLVLSASYDNLYSTIGWHPTEAGSYTSEIEAMIVQNLANPKVIALGEIGLDYHWMEDPKTCKKQFSVVKSSYLKRMIYLLLFTLVMP
jgi:TatD DNase family protein